MEQRENRCVQLVPCPHSANNEVFFQVSSLPILFSWQKWPCGLSQIQVRNERRLFKNGDHLKGDYFKHGWLGELW